MGSGPPQYSFKVIDKDGKPAPLTPFRGSDGERRELLQGKNGETRCIPGGSNVHQVRIAPGGKWHDVFPIYFYVDFTRPGKYAVRLIAMIPIPEPSSIQIA